MKLVRLLPLLLMVFAIVSCGDDDDGVDDDPRVNCMDFGNDTDVQAAAEAYIQAASAYGQEPNEANCTAYLNALDNYFEVIDVYVNDCYDEESFQQWRDAIEEWRAERDQLDCE